MSIYLDKLAHVQLGCPGPEVVINCRYFIAQMCNHEDMLAHNLGAPYMIFGYQRKDTVHPHFLVL